MVDHVGEQFGDYRLIRRLGGGSFGDVYLAEHSKDKTQVAVKVLSALLTNEEDVRNYINEIRALFLLHHPNIVPLSDFGVEQTVPFLVMPYTPNGTLHRPRGTRFPSDPPMKKEKVSVRVPIAKEYDRVAEVECRFG